METNSYKELRDRWADEAGLPAATLLDEDAGKFNRAFNRGIRRAWDWYRWPFLCTLEQRYFRPLWVAGAYATIAEVYHEASDTYWRANDTTAAADEPDDSAKWDEITDLDPYIEYEQEGETGFSYVVDVWTENFRTTTGARKLAWEYDDRGVRLMSGVVANYVWLHFYPRCPRWKGDAWVNSSIYAAGTPLYFADATNPDFDGDYFLVLDTTAAAESPITTPAKFARLEIPAVFSDFLVQAALVSYLKGEDQFDKAMSQDGGALLDILAEERMKFLAGGAPPRRARVANI